MKKASSDLSLLNVNVLLAIAWPNHQFHSTAIVALPSQQATDAYLVKLAAANNAVLVTFDKRLVSVAGDQPRVTVLG